MKTRKSIYQILASLSIGAGVLFGLSRLALIPQYYQTQNSFYVDLRDKAEANKDYQGVVLWDSFIKTPTELDTAIYTTEVTQIGGTAVVSIALVVLFWLLAWRCDLRYRTERQHMQVVAAINALRPKPVLGEQPKPIQRLETQQKR